MNSTKKLVVAAATLAAVAATGEPANATEAYCNPYGFTVCVTSTYCEWPVNYQCRTIALANCGGAAPHYGLGSHCTYDMGCFPYDKIVCLAGDD